MFVTKKYMDKKLDSKELHIEILQDMLHSKRVQFWETYSLSNNPDKATEALKERDKLFPPEVEQYET